MVVKLCCKALGIDFTKPKICKNVLQYTKENLFNMNRLNCSIIVSLLILVGCSDSSTNFNEVELNKEFNLQLGDSAILANQGLIIKYPKPSVRIQGALSVYFVFGQAMQRWFWNLKVLELIRIPWN